MTTVPIVEALVPLAALIASRGRLEGGKLGRGPWRRRLRKVIDVQLKATWKYGAAVEAALPGTTLDEFNAANPLHARLSETRVEVDRVFVEALRAFPELEQDKAGLAAFFVIRQHGSDELKALLQEPQWTSPGNP